MRVGIHGVFATIFSRREEPEGLEGCMVGEVNQAK
jgi:hypothetical protein